MESIGIKLADGSFYPILEDGKPEKKNLSLTTVKDNQRTVHVDLYRSKSGSMDDAEYVDTLEITNLNPHGNGEPSLTLDIELDADNKLNARINDPETGIESVKNVSLVSRSPEERDMPANFSLEPTAEDEKPFEEIFNEPKKDAPEDKDMSFEEILNSISEPKDEETDSNPFAITKQDVEDLDKINTTDSSDATDKDESSEETVASEDSNESDSAETPETEERELIGPAPNSEDFAFDDIPTSKQEESPFNLADFVSPAEEVPVKKEPVAEESFELPDFDALQEEIPATEEIVPEETVLDLPDFKEAEPEEVIPETEAETNSDTTESIEEPVFDLPDFDSTQDNTQDNVTDNAGNNEFELPEAFQTTAEEVSAEDSFQNESLKDPFDLSGFDSVDNTEEIASEEPLPTEPASEESVSKEIVSEETVSEEPVSEEKPFDLPDFDDATSSIEEPVFDLPKFDDSTQQDADTALDLPDFGNIDTPTDSVFDLPDFNNTTNASERIVEPLSIDSSKDDFTAFDLPDFGDDSDGTDFTVPNFDEEETNTDFVLPDFENDAGTSTSATITPQNMFSDLYDKETLEGKSSSAYDDYSDSRKQSKAPVVICLICALICLLSLLFLFVLPTNMNLITRAQTIAQKTEKPENPDDNEIAAKDGTSNDVASNNITSNDVSPSNINSQDNAPAIAEIPEPVPAKENEIVIATVPSQVVPAKPAKPASNLPDTKYTVVWGDTLWDISNAYYKNPWRYTYLAEYNHLKNPNYIKAGSVILIPAE